MLPLLGSEQTRLYVAVADFVMLFRFLAEAAFVVPCDQHFCAPCLFGKDFKNIVQGNDSLLRSKERLAYSFKGTIDKPVSAHTA